MRTLVIGDIHGALKALKQALERADYNPISDRLIFLGDYVDGWPESAELVQYLIELKDNASVSSVNHEMIIFLRGNHDQWCHEWFQNGVAHDMWLLQGGKSTFDSYLYTGYLTEDSHRDFFKNLANYYIDEENRGFVHGGFKSRQGLGHAHSESDYYWDRDMWELACAMHRKYVKTEGKLETYEDFNEFYRPNPIRFMKHKEIFIGHTSTINWKSKPNFPEFEDPNQPKNGPVIIPMNRCNVWNMDTGAGWSGKVSIMDVGTKEYWQSDFVKELYPNHKGR